jgi:hypothetical protein
MEKEERAITLLHDVEVLVKTILLFVISELLVH